VWDVIAWYQDVDTGGSLTALNAVDDAIYATSGKDIYVKRPWLIYAFGYGANIIRGQLRAPSFGTKHREIPISSSLSVAPYFLEGGGIYSLRPQKLDINEPLNAYVAENAGSGTSDKLFVVVFLADRPKVVQRKDYDYVLRLTGSTTLTVGEWTQVSLTPDVTLPEGVYRILGMIPISAGCIVARIVATNIPYRPGFKGDTSEVGTMNGDRLAGLFLGDTGVEFTPRAIPKVEFLSKTADTSEVVYFFVKKVR